MLGIVFPACILSAWRTTLLWGPHEVSCPIGQTLTQVLAGLPPILCAPIILCTCLWEHFPFCGDYWSVDLLSPSRPQIPWGQELHLIYLCVSSFRQTPCHIEGARSIFVKWEIPPLPLLLLVLSSEMFPWSSFCQISPVFSGLVRSLSLLGSLPSPLQIPLNSLSSYEALSVCVSSSVSQSLPGLLLLLLSHLYLFWFHSLLMGKWRAEALP